MSASVHKNSAKCWVRGCNVQCRSFANSLLAIHYSPLATHHSLPFYHSPFTFATRHSLLAAVSARQNLALPLFAPPTEVGGYETKPAKAGCKTGGRIS